jgi:CubicO group peptidase (beta-lactamase class C family)
MKLVLSTLASLALLFPVVVSAKPHCTGRAEAAQLNSASITAGIETVVADQMRRRAIPGMQVAVVRGGRVVYEKAFGIADLETGAAVTPATNFTLNSATKSFTGVAIMQLVQDGKLSLDAPIGRYLPDLAVAWRGVTVAQLLSHLSGLPDVLIQPKGQGTGSLVGEGDETSAWTAVQAMPFQSPTGTRFSYNQTNYVLLGKIIDRVSGMPFTRFIQTRQFAPAGMRTAAFGDGRDVMSGRVRTYRYRGGAAQGQTRAIEHAWDEFSPFMRTAGGLNASAGDVAHWLIALDKGVLLAPSSRQALWTPGRFNDGRPGPWSMGWPLSDHGGHAVAAGIGGRRSAFFVYPRDDLAVVVLTNLAGANPEEFVDEIAGQFLPDLLAANGGGLPLSVKRLRTALIANDFADPRRAYDRLKQKPGFQLNEDDLNGWGGMLLDAGQVRQAVAVFGLNVELHPESANALDSLAMAFEAANDRPRAIANYEASLKRDPDNGHAVGRLAVLKEQTK